MLSPLFACNCKIYTLWLSSADEPESGTTSFAKYDPQGQPRVFTDADSVVTTRDYDCAGRLLSDVSTKTGPPTTIALGYDAASFLGRLTSSSHSDGNTTKAYEYEGRQGRLSEITTGILDSTFVQSRTYDLLGLPATMTYPSSTTDRDGHAVTTLTAGYAQGFLNSLSDVTVGTLLVETDRDPSGALSRARLSGTPTLEQQWSYDPRNRISRVTATAGSTTLFDSGVYQFDRSNNITAMGAETFRYYPTGELKTAAMGPSIAYSYDDFGNLVSRTGLDAFQAVMDAAPSKNQIKCSASGGGSCNSSCQGSGCTSAWGYSPAGNITLDPERGYVWNEKDQLWSVTLGGTTTYNVYDADGYRVDLTSAQGCVENRRLYVRDRGGKVLSEYHQATNCTLGVLWLRDYIYADGKLIAAVQNATLRAPSIAGHRINCDPVGEPLVVLSVTDPTENACRSRGINIYLCPASGDCQSTPINTAPLAAPCPALATQVDSGLPETICYEARSVHWSGEEGPPSARVCVSTFTCTPPILSCPSPAAPTAARKLRYYFTDHLGTPRATVKPDGALTETLKLGPYGEDIDAAGCGQRPQFTGHERDAESGLDYALARYYSRHTGRFLSTDPIASIYSGQSRYVYSKNSPTSYYDPDGRSPVKAVGWIIKLTEKGYRKVSRMLTRRELAKAVAHGDEVLTISGKESSRVARAAGNGRRPVRDPAHPAPDGSLEGRMPHYHPNGRPKDAGHVFYSAAAALTVAHYTDGHGTAAELIGSFADFFNPLGIAQDAVDIGELVSRVGEGLIEGESGIDGSTSLPDSGDMAEPNQTMLCVPGACNKLPGTGPSHGLPAY